MQSDVTPEPVLRADQLRGFRIGVTSDRRSEDLITALERRGAPVLHAPALQIAPNDQDAQLLAETRAVIRRASGGGAGDHRLRDAPLVRGRRHRRASGRS